MLQLREWETSAGAIGVFTGSALSIPSGKILDKNCKSLHWWQTFR